MYTIEFIRITEMSSGMSVTLESNDYKNHPEETGMVKETERMGRKFERNRN